MRQAPLAWCLTGLLLAAALATPFPALRVYAALGLILLLPGALVTPRLSRDGVAAIPLAFCVSLALLIPAGLIGYGAGLPFSALKWLYGGTVIMVLLAVLTWRRPSSEKLEISWGALPLAALAALWSLQGYLLGADQGSDGIGTAIILRKLVEEPSLAPVTYMINHAQVDATSSSYQLLYLAIGLVAELARVDVIVTWINLPAFLAPLFLAAFFTFVRSAFDSPAVALAAAIILVWAHTLDPRATQVLPLLSRVAMIPYFLALAQLFICLREGQRSKVLLASTLGALAVLLYLGALFLIAVGLSAFGLWLYIFSKNRGHVRETASMLLGVVALSGPYLAIILPYYFADQAVRAEVAPHAHTFLTVAGLRIADPAWVIWALGGVWGWRTWAFVGGLLAVVPLWRYRRTIWGGFFLSSLLATLVVLFNPVTVEAMLLVLFPGKITKFVPMLATYAGIPLLAFGMVQALRWLASSAYGPRAAWAGGIAGTCLLVVVGWSRLDYLANAKLNRSLGYVFKHYVLERNYPYEGFLMKSPAIYRKIGRYVEPGAVVASVSLTVGAFTNVYLPAGLQEMRQIFDPAIPLGETSRLLSQYKVQYVLNFASERPLQLCYAYRELGLEPGLLFVDSKFDQWPGRFQRLYASGGWVLYRVRSEGDPKLRAEPRS